MALFFTIAVFLTGGLYSVARTTRFGVDALDTLTIVALVFSLSAVLLVLARIFWITSKSALKTNSTSVDERA